MNASASALETLRARYADRESVARGHKEAGAKVVGYISNNVPVEMIVAAGMFPLHVWGSPEDDTPNALLEMEDFFDGYALSIYERMLAGRYGFLDLLIVPRSSEVCLQLYYLLIEAKRHRPELDIPDVYLFDVLHTPYWTTGRYNRGRLDALRARLAEVAGRDIGDDDLRRGIAVVNDNRAALEELAALRRETPPRLSGTDALRIIGASMFMGTEEHTALVRDLIAAPGDLPPPPDGPRLMVKGSPVDSTALYELVEGCGAVVVADDHILGQRWFEYPVIERADPMEALTEKYHLYSTSLRVFPQSRENDRFLEIVEAAGVEGVVFFHDEWDDTLGWDYPAQRDLLNARDIPSAFLKHQSYRAPDRDAQAHAVRDLIMAIDAEHQLSA